MKKWFSLYCTFKWTWRNVLFLLILSVLLCTMRGLFEYKKKSLSKKRRTYSNEGSSLRVGVSKSVLFDPMEPSLGNIIWAVKNELGSISCLKDLILICLMNSLVFWSMHILNSSTDFFFRQTLLKIASPSPPLLMIKNIPFT